MSIVLKRKEAIKLVSYVQMFLLNSNERKVKLEDAFAEFGGLTDVSDADTNLYLRKYIKIEMRFVKNSYIQGILSKHFSAKVIVVGNEPKLYRCYCCGYKTLEERGGYDICEVCYWEDTGSNEEERHSGPNHMTLKEGKRNFRKFGVSKKRWLQFVDKDRFLKYDK